ncbi:MAG: N-acetylneuraminate synthase family protein, partial [Dehalococcoidales bacterium]
TKEIVLLHCVTSYPAKVEDTNLKVIETLKRTFEVPVGLSDHTPGVTIPIAAVALGACAIEKHFTLDKKLPGPDHKASLEPDELAETVKAIRDVEKAMGDGVKRLTKDEEENKKVARHSLVAKIDIPKGVIITEDMLDAKRPGTGIHPKYLDKIVGKKTKKALKQNEILSWEAIEK